MVNMRYEILDIDSVKLDIKNPRIAQSLEMYGPNITSEEIALALGGVSGDSGSTSYDGLFESIKVNQGIINPIIVNHESTGEYTVIEGNTRVQIYKELRQANPEGPWNTIPSLVYENMSEQEIHEIRLQAHLVGPRNWNPFSKAKYLYELSEQKMLPIDTIVSLCGGKEKKSEIIKSINAYKDMMNYYKPLTETGDYFFYADDFSYFVELQNGTVRNSLTTSGKTKTDFSKWVLEQKIVNAQNVRKLPNVLLNKKATDVFEKDGITEALKFVTVTEQTPLALAQVSLNDLVVELTNRIKAYGFNDLRRLRSSKAAENERNNILDLNDELDNLISEFEEEEDA